MKKYVLFLAEFQRDRVTLYRAFTILFDVSFLHKISVLANVDDSLNLTVCFFHPRYFQKYAVKVLTQKKSK